MAHALSTYPVRISDIENHRHSPPISQTATTNTSPPLTHNRSIAEKCGANDGVAGRRGQRLPAGTVNGLMVIT